MTNPNDTSFPIFDECARSTKTGLTKREYFAAMAMQGLLANGIADFKYPPNETAAKCAASIADDLIKALNAETSHDH